MHYLCPCRTGRAIPARLRSAKCYRVRNIYYVLPYVPHQIRGEIGKLPIGDGEVLFFLIFEED